MKKKLTNAHTLCQCARAFTTIKINGNRNKHGTLKNGTSEHVAHI